MALGQALAVFTDGRACPKGTTPQQFAVFLAKELKQPVPVLVPEQRHTATVFTFSGKLPAPGPHNIGVCDALMTAEPGVALAVQTADCLPVALAAPTAVALLHAGWRGLAQGLLPKTVDLLVAQFGVTTQVITAIIGVGVGPCHYPVGEEVIESLCQSLGRSDGFFSGNRVSLATFAQLALAQSGLAPENIRTLPGCTACSPTYHSFRRDGPAAGRQWAAVLLQKRNSPSRS